MDFSIWRRIITFTPVYVAIPLGFTCRSLLEIVENEKHAVEGFPVDAGIVPSWCRVEDLLSTYKTIHSKSHKNVINPHEDQWYFGAKPLWHYNAKMFCHFTAGPCFRLLDKSDPEQKTLEDGVDADYKTVIALRNVSKHFFVIFCPHGHYRLSTEGKPISYDKKLLASLDEAFGEKTSDGFWKWYSNYA
jgi:hypothetical protein